MSWLLDTYQNLKLKKLVIVIYFSLRQLPFPCLSTRERHLIMFLSASSAPQTYYKALPVSSKALFLLKPSNSYRHNYTRMRSTCCASTAFLEQLMPARQAVQWEVEKRGRKRMWAGSEKNPSLCLSRRKKRAVIITLEALDCNLSPLCVNLCIHQVFAGGLWKDHTFPASICLWRQN